VTKDVQHFHSKVVGVSHKNPDGSKRQDIIKAVDVRPILIHY
jgi:hypothetical protein